MSLPDTVGIALRGVAGPAVIPNVVSCTPPTAADPCFHLIESNGTNRWFPMDVVLQVAFYCAEIAPEGTQS